MKISLFIRKLTFELLFVGLGEEFKIKLKNLEWKKLQKAIRSI